jgi:class 3 adenylate cyclase
LELAVPSAEEIRKTVTVVFCDVVGSTALGERLDPESVRRAIGRYFDEARAAIERHGGTVEKFIGDAVMSVFGFPGSMRTTRSEPCVQLPSFVMQSLFSVTSSRPSSG